MKIEIVRMDEKLVSLLPQKQEAFQVIGRLVPLYDGNSWTTKEERIDQPTEKTYPDEVYDPAGYVNNPDQAAFLAIQDGKRIGSIRVGKRWNGNAFIDDLLVDRDCRGQGAGTMLMDAAVCWARENKMDCVSLETQNGNLIACRFYLKYGFRLGGIDHSVYTHKDYRGETALYFYMPTNAKYR